MQHPARLLTARQAATICCPCPRPALLDRSPARHLAFLVYSVNQHEARVDAATNASPAPSATPSPSPAPSDAPTAEASFSPSPSNPPQPQASPSPAAAVAESDVADQATSLTSSNGQAQASPSPAATVAESDEWGLQPTTAEWSHTAIENPKQGIWFLLALIVGLSFGTWQVYRAAAKAHATGSWPWSKQTTPTATSAPVVTTTSSSSALRERLRASKQYGSQLEKAQAAGLAVGVGTKAASSSSNTPETYRRFPSAESDAYTPQQAAGSSADTGREPSASTSGEAPQEAVSTSTSSAPERRQPETTRAVEDDVQVTSAGSSSTLDQQQQQQQAVIDQGTTPSTASTPARPSASLNDDTATLPSHSAASTSSIATAAPGSLWASDNRAPWTPTPPPPPPPPPPPTAYTQRSGALSQSRSLSRSDSGLLLAPSTPVKVNAAPVPPIGKAVDPLSLDLLSNENTLAAWRERSSLSLKAAAAAGEASQRAAAYAAAASAAASRAADAAERAAVAAAEAQLRMEDMADDAVTACEQRVARAARAAQEAEERAASAAAVATSYEDQGRTQANVAERAAYVPRPNPSAQPSHLFGSLHNLFKSAMGGISNGLKGHTN